MRSAFRSAFRTAFVGFAFGASGCSGGDGEPGLELPGPVLYAVSPDLASSYTRVRLQGEGFAGGEVRVLFGESEGELLSVEPAVIWARGIFPPAGTDSVDVVVEVDGLSSNALPLAYVGGGVPRALAPNGLEDPRALALDVGGGLLWIFDAQIGVFAFSLANGAYNVHRAPDAGLLEPVAGVALSTTELLIADAATNSIVVLDVDTTDVTPRVSGLASVPTALALDAAGNLYWADGGPFIGRQAAAGGAVDAAFAQVPAASGIAVAGGALWASDPLAGVIHQVALPTAVTTTAFVAGLSGVNGMSADGTGVIACVTDAGGAGAVRVSAAGVVSVAAPEHPLAGAGAAACESGSGTIYSIASDGGVETSEDGKPWLLRAPVLGADASEGVWTNARFYVLSDARCASGGTGSIVEVVAPGSFRSKAAGVCARDTFHSRGNAGLLWVDRVSGFASRLDLATGTVAVIGSNGAFAGAQGAAARSDKSFFVTDALGALRMFDEDGVEVVLVAASGAHPAFSETLYFVDGDELRAGVFNHGDFLGTRLVAPVPGEGIADLAPNPDGGVLAVSGTTVLRISSNGAISFAGDVDAGDRVGRTPFGETFRMRDGVPPFALTPDGPL